MTEGTMLTPFGDDDERERKRKLALMKAVGLDKLPPEQRELAVNLAQRYGLDLLLKHLVMIEGRAYITRDGLLHVAHRSALLDGIEVTEPALGEDGFWRATCSVYRRDMARPFRYSGRYPAKGRNAQYAPEMAIKVAEVATLRRAFDVSMATIEEQWEQDGGDASAGAPAEGPLPRGPVTLADRVEERRARVVVAPPAQMMHVDPEPTIDETADQEGFGFALAEDAEPEEPEAEEVTPEELEEIIAEAQATTPAGVVEPPAAEPAGPIDWPARFMAACTRAGITREQISAAARRAFPSIPSTAYNDAHWKGLADELGLTL